MENPNQQEPAINTKNSFIKHGQQGGTTLCQQCRTNPATHKVPTMKGGFFRWKCESCFNKKVSSGFKNVKPRRDQPVHPRDRD